MKEQGLEISSSIFQLFAFTSAYFGENAQ